MTSPLPAIDDLLLQMPELVLFSRSFAIYEMDVGLSTRQRTHDFVVLFLRSFGVRNEDFIR
jgi:hypothetical protein